MKNTTPLTKEEKIDFLVNDNINCIVKLVNDYNKSKGLRKFLTIASAIANGGLIALCIAFWNPYSPMLISCALGAFTFPTIALNLHHKLWLNRTILDCSNGKIDLKEYTRLLKSGELSKWHEEFKEEVLERYTFLKNIETSEYNKEIKILQHCLDNSTQNVQITKDTTKLNNDISKE